MEISYDRELTRWNLYDLRFDIAYLNNVVEEKIITANMMLENTRKKDKSFDAVVSKVTFEIEPEDGYIEFYVIVWRTETSKETAFRKEAERKAEEARIKKIEAGKKGAAARKKAEEEREYAMYLELKSKFEGKKDVL